MKSKRQDLINLLEEQRQRLITIAEMETRLEKIRGTLYSPKATKISAVPSSHNPLLAMNRLRALLDEKIALEKKKEKLQSMNFPLFVALQLLTPSERYLIEEFYLSASGSAMARYVTTHGITEWQCQRLKVKALGKLHQHFFTQNKNYE